MDFDEYEWTTIKSKKEYEDFIVKKRKEYKKESHYDGLVDSLKYPLLVATEWEYNTGCGSDKVNYYHFTISDLKNIGKKLRQKIIPYSK